MKMKPFWIRTTKSLAAASKVLIKIIPSINCFMSISITPKVISAKCLSLIYTRWTDPHNKKHSIANLETICCFGTDRECLTLLVFCHKVWELHLLRLPPQVIYLEKVSILQIWLRKVSTIVGHMALNMLWFCLSRYIYLYSGSSRKA